MTLDATGLTIKRLPEIRAEIRADIAAAPALGARIQTSEDTAMGQLVDVFAVREASIWELLQALFDAFDPDQATGTELDNLAGLTGVTRNPATPSAVVLRYSGTNGTAIPIGTIARVPNGPRFVTTSAGVIAGGILDVTAEAEETGPIEAIAAAIDEQVTVIAGVSSVTNPAASIVGQDIETDDELRVRREQSLSIVGAGVDQAIAARLGELDTVDSAIVISNRTLVTDGLGIPGKAFRSIVWPAQVDDDPIWLAIWQTMPAGILSDGAIAGTAIDAQGNAQPVAYSVATEIVTFITAVVVTDPLSYAGDAAVAAAVESVTGDFSIGEDVILFKITCAVAEVAGIVDIEIRAKVGSAPGPSDTVNIPVALTEIATVDPGDIAVSSS